MAISVDVIFSEAITNEDIAYPISNTNISKADTTLGYDSISVKNPAAFLTENTKTKGLLIVKIIVNNKDTGNKTSFDFVIKIHANDPIPASFHGSSNGTTVNLGMGMYSVSQSFVPGYYTIYSSECFGGIMSIETKKCVITNVYDNASTTIKR
jgi:hypothetical protein